MTQGPDHVALVGLSGTGKSTVAPLLAERRGLACVDVDGEVVALAGRSVADVFATDGEAAFRELESAALSRALDGPPAVIATGGGIVLDADNRTLLSGRATVVWLRADPAALAGRLAGTSEDRPLLAGGTGAAADRLARMASERAPLYEAVADAALTVDGRSVDDVVDAVDALLEDLLATRGAQ